MCFTPETTIKGTTNFGVIQTLPQFLYVGVSSRDLKPNPLIGQASAEFFYMPMAFPNPFRPLRICKISGFPPSHVACSPSWSALMLKVFAEIKGTPLREKKKERKKKKLYVSKDENKSPPYPTRPIWRITHVLPS